MARRFSPLSLPALLGMALAGGVFVSDAARAGDTPATITPDDGVLKVLIRPAEERPVGERYRDGNIDASETPALPVQNASRRMSLAAIDAALLEEARPTRRYMVIPSVRQLPKPAEEKPAQLAAYGPDISLRATVGLTGIGYYAQTVDSYNDCR